jgi:hypothetical protein
MRSFCSQLELLTARARLASASLELDCGARSQDHVVSEPNFLCRALYLYALSTPALKPIDNCRSDA